MHLLFARHFWTFLFGILLTGAAAAYVYFTYYTTVEIIPETAIVTLADVEQTVTVSGKITAEQTAKLGFAVGGTIQHIYKKTGDQIATGDVIASLTSNALVADYSSRLERVRYYEQIKQQLLRGATPEEKSVARSNVLIAEATLATTEANYTQLVKNARQNLLSTDLQAYPTNIENDDTPPQISGSYECDTEGTYSISIFNSNAKSGISYHLNGLGTGTYAANTEVAEPLADCGLFIKFSATEKYKASDWLISIPNKRSASYIARKNAYDQAVIEATSAITAAKEALVLAQNSERVVLATSTAENIAQAEANIQGAKAELIAQESRIADYTIRAPFSGIISDVNMKVGEPVGPTQTITIVFEGIYELEARIPEIDITEVKPGNEVKIVFDAAPEETFLGTVSFISPLSTDVGGVSYYETKITLTDYPSWIREGLNSDVEIQSQSIKHVPTIPKRFLKTTDSGTFVLIQTPTGIVETVVTPGLIGTNGLVAVTNLTPGAVVILP